MKEKIEKMFYAFTEDGDLVSYQPSEIFGFYELPEEIQDFIMESVGE